MTELSVRLLKQADLLVSRGMDEHTAAGVAELQAEAFRWTALAAERGDARAIFDQAYLLQFGIGTRQDQELSQKLYGKLLGGSNGWPARVAALSWLGLSAARRYFLRAWDGFRRLLESVAQTWELSEGSDRHRPARERESQSVSSQLLEACNLHSGGYVASGRLVFWRCTAGAT